MDINVFAHSRIYTDKIETHLDLWRIFNLSVVIVYILLKPENYLEQGFNGVRTKQSFSVD